MSMSSTSNATLTASNAMWKTLGSSDMASSNAAWETLDSSGVASNALWKTLDSSNVGQASSLLLNKFSSLPSRTVPMQVDAATNHYHAPKSQPRSIIKKQWRRPNDQKRRLSFRGSVDVRVSLVDRPPPGMIWYTANEIKSMKSAAMSRASPLRHSDLMEASKTIQLQQHLLASPPPPEVEANDAPAPPHGWAARSPMSRVHSANAELDGAPASHRPSPRDIRYQKLVGEMDREVFIRNEDRRNSTRRRLHHYCKVLDEIDRQVEEGYMMLDVHELACASRGASGDAMARAIERGRKEATVAQAITMMEMRRL